MHVIIMHFKIVPKIKELKAKFIREIVYIEK